MRRSVVTVSLLTWLCTAFPVVAADQPRVVELWRGQVPDETGTIGPETVRMSPKLDRTQVEVTEPTRMVTNVTRPTLTIYRPAKEKDTGTAVLICPGGGYWNLYWELEGEEVRLKLVGFGPNDAGLKSTFTRRLGHRVELVDRVSQAELVSHLAAAQILVCPRPRHRAGAEAASGRLGRARGRIWAGAQHSLHPRKGRQALHADRVDLSLPARASVGGCGSNQSGSNKLPSASRFPGAGESRHAQQCVWLATAPVHNSPHFGTRAENKFT